MISLCASAEAVSANLLRSSKERLQQELAARDAIIESLTKQMELLTQQKPKKEKKRKQSLIQSIARRFSFHQRKQSKVEAAIVEAEWIVGDDNNYDLVVVDQRIEGDVKSVPRARSVSELQTQSPIDQLYASCSLWNLSSSTCSMLLRDDVEYTLEQVMNGESNGSLNLDNESCMLVYGCPKELVPLLSADFVAERERRWLLRNDFIDALNDTPPEYQ